MLPVHVAVAKNKYFKPYRDFSASPKYSSLVVHMDTGRVMHSDNSKMKRYPASLTKIMTLYILFDEMNKGRLNMAQKMCVSKKASRQPRSNLNLKAGSYITVRDAMLGLIVKSANDAAVVIAEHIGGSEEKFSQMMTAKAKELGMRDTLFCNASGLPHRSQSTTAHDMAVLAMAMHREHAKYYHFFSKTSFVFKGRVIQSHNHMVKRYKWATGLKTGFINASGYNIVTTTKKPEGRMVAVVMGGPTVSIRDSHTVDLLEAAYRRIAPAKKRRNTGVNVALCKQSNNQLSRAKPNHLQTKATTAQSNPFEVLSPTTNSLHRVRSDVPSPFAFTP